MFSTKISCRCVISSYEIEEAIYIEYERAKRSYWIITQKPQNGRSSTSEVGRLASRPSMKLDPDPTSGASWTYSRVLEMVGFVCLDLYV